MHDLIAQFGINWQIIVAQMVNFTILFLVLRKFVYKPLIEFLDKRRETIEEGIRLKDSADQELQKARQEGQQIITQSRLDAKSVIEETKNKAKDLESQLIEDAKQKNEEILRQGRNSFERERAQMVEQINAKSEDFLKKALKTVLSKTDISENDQKAIDQGLRELKNNLS